MALDIWLTFVAASTILLIIPGPTILLVMSYALSQGRTIALATVAGVAFAAINALAYALLADRLRMRIARPTVLSGLSCFGGCTLIAMGIITATFRRVSA